MPDITNKVIQATGYYPGHGKFENEPNASLTVYEWIMDGNDGDDLAVDEGYGFACEWLTDVDGEFHPDVRAIVAFETTDGFFIVRYFDNADDAHNHYCALTEDWA